ncbi:hypothetical protein CVS40_5547 [Lucilia cuprina]|nr:hypothetical protein CVS40_5547 [Lucilia cuprina]
MDYVNLLIISFFFANGFTRITLILAVIIQRWKRDKELEKLFRELFSLHFKYFIHFKITPRNNSLRYLWIFNAFLFVIHNLMLAIQAFTLVSAVPFYMIIEYILIISLSGMQHIIMLHHAATLCCLFEYFSVLNHQLQTEDFNYDLSCVYFHLCKLLKQVNKIYAAVLFFLQLNNLVIFSLIMFLIVMILPYPALIEEHIEFIQTLGYIFLVIIHMLVYYIICDQVCNISSTTNGILSQSTTRNVNKELEKFTLECVLLSTDVNVYGMFKINSCFLFTISANIFSYMILLLQTYMQISVL